MYARGYVDLKEPNSCFQKEEKNFHIKKMNCFFSEFIIYMYNVLNKVILHVLYFNEYINNLIGKRRLQWFFIPFHALCRLQFHNLVPILFPHIDQLQYHPSVHLRCISSKEYLHRYLQVMLSISLFNSLIFSLRFLISRKKFSLCIFFKRKWMLRQKVEEPAPHLCYVHAKFDLNYQILCICNQMNNYYSYV